jgi:hypothetical protein
MAGSLLKLWPWHLPTEVVAGKPMGVQLLLPGGFEAQGGGEPAVLGVIVAILLGLGVVAGLELLTRASGMGDAGGHGGANEVPGERAG